MMQGPVRRTVTIVNQRGLHARASAKFVTLASQFSVRITVAKDTMSVCASSIMGLMMLGAGLGETIVIEAQGEGAERAVSALCALVEARFDESI